MLLVKIVLPWLFLKPPNQLVCPNMLCFTFTAVDICGGRLFSWYVFSPSSHGNNLAQ